MLTKISVKNFKRLDAELDLSSVVVFVGPNNSGKTSALQAISLWESGLRKWYELKGKISKAKKRTGAAINRKEIYNIPVPSLKQLWRDLQVKKQIREKDRQMTKNIAIEISVDGITEGQEWSVGLEFDFANPESCYVRPVDSVSEETFRLAMKEHLILLPPMSGLSAEEYKLEPGTINVFIGQGKTADVLRNLCWYVFSNKRDKWQEIVELIDKMFAIKVNPPEYDATTGRITVTYRERNTDYDLINGGRGFHQVLLLLSYIYFNSGSVVLIDEPDAHLEILRQKQVFNLLCDILTREKSQLIIATHSEALLNEAVHRSSVIAFLGKPHIVNTSFQLIKSLTTIGFEQYLLAEQKKWVLYLEGSTDLNMLKGFARILKHPVLKYLETPFTKYVGNIPEDARNHFYGLKEAVHYLKGIAIYDRMEKTLNKDDLFEMMWERREIENYLPLPDVIVRYFESQHRDLFSSRDSEIIREIIKEEVPPAALKDKDHNFWINTKISDDFLDRIFKKFAMKKNTSVPIYKKDYHLLIQYAEPEEISEEVKEKLDKILEIAKIEDDKIDL
jgi:AAA15 family ATPase/GTPase